MDEEREQPLAAASATRALAGLLLVAAAGAGAQQQDPPNAILLIAKPAIQDVNFRRSVVLVTQARDGHTVGVILNRPMKPKLTELHPQLPSGPNYQDALYFGGPVMRQTIAAVFEMPAPPEAPAFHLLPGVYMTLHPANIDLLLAGVSRRYRLYSGFSGWAPGQLDGELQRDGWFVQPASADTLFRKDMSTLWQEMINKSQGQKTEGPAEVGPKTEGPAEAGPVARLGRALEVPRERHVVRGLRHVSEPRVAPCPSSTALLFLALPGQVARDRAVDAPGEPERACALLRAK